ncbi:MAG: 23S rRNA (guanosine(2251)-2'-O)-methyltransferase RlmB [Nevskia sp.]|jgi:23S rRNA (guanosine2251-2'-O)-methyltransferase|nr:23S rRNA (guanosine(2251)-2'-O)-methyltransferase RlmB [Nevskia sp.]
MAETYIGGFHAVIAAIEDGTPKPREILLAETRKDSRAERLLELAAKRKITVRKVSRDTLDLRAPGLRHQGVLAEIEAADLGGEEILDLQATPDRMLLVLDGVQDPHNLGACLRTSEAVGVNAVIIPRDRAVGVTPAVRSAAAGSAERVPVVAVTNLVRKLEQLKQLGYWTVGLDAEGGESLYDVDLTGPLVLVMGGEAEGLRRLTRETCDRIVKIPMASERIESLNVSVAAAVCLYEAFRQRNGKRKK